MNTFLGLMAAQIEADADALPVRDTASLRGLRREYSKRLSASTAAEVIEVAQALLGGRKLHRFFADELIANHRAARESLTLDVLERLGEGLSSWDEVDCFGCYLSGPAWRERRIEDQDVAGWARSSDRWWRRAALVSTVPLNVRARGGSGDAVRTLAVCELLVEDRDDMVVKALSWALRALAQRDPGAVRDFVAAHGGQLASRVKRQVGSKLATGLKNPRVIAAAC